MEMTNGAGIENTTVTKVLMNECETPYYMIVFWGDGGDAKLTLINNDQYWKGESSPENFSHYYENLDMTEEQYMTNTKNALTTNSKDNEFIFEFKNNELKWKIADPSSNINIIHGAVKFAKYWQEGGTGILIDTLLQMKEVADDKLKNQEQESKELAKQMQGIIEKFEVFSKLKVEMENDLYVKFISLLNSKKESAANFEEFIHSVREDTKYVSRFPALGNVQRQVHTMSDSDSESNHSMKDYNNKITKIQQ